MAAKIISYMQTLLCDGQQKNTLSTTAYMSLILITQRKYCNIFNNMHEANIKRSVFKG